MQINRRWQSNYDEVAFKYNRKVGNSTLTNSKSIEGSEYIRQGDKIHVRHRNQYHRSNTESNNA
jgi:hypothetical protein